MLCPQCRATVEDDSRFCRHCGARMAAPGLTDPPAASEPGRDLPPEREVWTGRPVFRGFAGTWVLWLAAFIVALYLTYRYADSGEAVRMAVWWLGAATAAAILVRQALIIAGIRYRITSQRLILERGILSRVTDQTELFRVDDVRIRQGVVDRLLDTGNIEILSSDETDKDLTLRSVDKPGAVAETLRLSIRSARGRQTLFVQNV